MTFRKANEKDLNAIEDIYSAIHTQQENGLVTIGWIRNIYPTRATAEMALQRNDLFVAEEDGVVVGAAIINQQQVDVYENANWQYSVLDSEVMVLHTLAMSPKAAGKGYGKQFIRFYEEYAKSHDCTYLRMDTNEINVRARALYKKLGYSEVDVVPCVFNGIEGVQLVLLEKRLQGANCCRTYIHNL